jgi:biopolymer transport protein ExbB
MVRVLLVVVILAALVPAMSQAQDKSKAAPAVPTTQDANAADANAPRYSRPGEALLRKFKQGGRTMWFLLALSVFGVTFTLERIVHLRRGAIVPRRLSDKADALWKQGKFDEALQLCDKSKSTLGRILSATIRYRHVSAADMSAIAGDIASRDLKRHLQRAYPLAIVATLSPLLGLLGTVIGMIGAFETIALMGALGDASMLGGDISKALVTTGAGLGIAVPALALYHYFKSRTSLFGIILEEEVSELLIEWKLVDPQTGNLKEAGNAS